ncbi:hypothetical protein VTN00DRAFT_3295 [Thermoascus crustaceus]|uniref:uncharacterized protein n=1 Tax=Thermoascus crustaceus TaxID=5088 RepID=UPI00374295AD
MTGIIQEVQGLPPYKARNPTVPWSVFQDYFTRDYSQWSTRGTSGVPIDNVFNAIGSTKNAEHLVTAERELNSMKGRVVGVFRYLNQFIVSSAARQAYQNVEREFVTFQDRYNKGPGVVNEITINLRNLWREYVTTFLDRLVQWARPWVLNRIAELEVVWQDVAANTVGNDHVTASAILSDLAILRRHAMQYMDIDTSGFWIK